MCQICLIYGVRRKRWRWSRGSGTSPSPIPLILNSQLTHLVTDPPSTRTEPPATRAPRAVAAQLHVRGRAPAVYRQRVNLMLVPERGTRWCTLLMWRRLSCCTSPTTTTTTTSVPSDTTPKPQPKSRQGRGGRSAVGWARKKVEAELLDECVGVSFSPLFEKFFLGGIGFG